uniref:Uncharacterized protein n=1 Tax=Anguilla anguilla TaxID=7936 RepID=A0A0E9XFS4_ANGAN
MHTFRCPLDTSTFHPTEGRLGGPSSEKELVLLLSASARQWQCTGMHYMHPKLPKLILVVFNNYYDY